MAKNNNIKFIQTFTIYKYINNNDSLEEAYQSLIDYNNRLDAITKVFSEKGIKNSDISNIYDIYEISIRDEIDMYNDYLFNNKYTIDEIVNPILEQKTRKECLKNELNKYNIKLRDDSIMCSEYIKLNNRSLETVVTMMIEMDFFYKYTQYKKQRKNSIGNP